MILSNYYASSSFPSSFFYLFLSPFPYHSHHGLWCEHLYNIQHLCNTEHLYNIPQKTSFCQQRTLGHAWTKGKMSSKVRLSLCRGTVRIPWLFHDFAKWYFSLTISWPILNMNLYQRERERENPKPHLKLSEKEFESALNLVSVQLEFPDFEKCYFFAILSWPVITIYLIYQGGTGNLES